MQGKQTDLFQTPYVFIFHRSLLVSGVGPARTEKCARRVRSVWTSVIHLRWSAPFVIVEVAAVGGSEDVRSQSRLAGTPSAALACAHTFTPGSLPVKPQLDLLDTAGPFKRPVPRIVLTLPHPRLFGSLGIGLTASWRQAFSLMPLSIDFMERWTNGGIQCLVGWMAKGLCRLMCFLLKSRPYICNQADYSMNYRRLI